MPSPEKSTHTTNKKTQFITLTLAQTSATSITNETLITQQNFMSLQQEHSFYSEQCSRSPQIQVLTSKQCATHKQANTSQPDTTSRKVYPPKLIYNIPSPQPETTLDDFGALPPTQAWGDVPPDFPEPPSSLLGFLNMTSPNIERKPSLSNYKCNERFTSRTALFPTSPSSFPSSPGRHASSKLFRIT